MSSISLSPAVLFKNFIKSTIEDHLSVINVTQRQMSDCGSLDLIYLTLLIRDDRFQLRVCCVCTINCTRLRDPLLHNEEDDEGDEYKVFRSRQSFSLVDDEEWNSDHQNWSHFRQLVNWHTVMDNKTLSDVYQTLLDEPLDMLVNTQSVML